MEITSIKNKNTKQEVCSQYLHKELDLDKCQYVLDKALKIRYTNGSIFTHEIVRTVEFMVNGNIVIETTKKVWTIHKGQIKNK